MENYYKILGVSEKATSKEIKSAYRQEMRKCHPDKIQNLDDKAKAIAAEQVNKLKQAVEYLEDPEQRKKLDDYLRATILKRKREEEMDESRKTMKNKLQEREKAVNESPTQQVDADKAKFKAKLKEELAKAKAKAAS
eukprot:c5237_g1_i1.p1 GENE.c5237_g1_i1~~c5237_g1_i1.p1  ORF type:complete len:137 (+),score=69.80 c5237_g1_i1:154-564(+)